MDFEDAFSNPAFWILAGIGEGAFVIMLIVLKGMGSQEIMPSWVKIVTFLVVPVIAFLWASMMGDD